MLGCCLVIGFLELSVTYKGFAVFTPVLRLHIDGQ